jgi:hypothetical protein
MRTVVTFQSRSFNTTEPKEYFINECCFGDDLCKWLIQRLRANSIQTDDEPGQEDFGWYFEFTVPDGAHCLVLGFRPGDTDDDEDWVGWIERSKGPLGSIFGGRNKGIASSALTAIHTVLSNASEISNVRWHEKADFDRGREELGSPTP